MIIDSLYFVITINLLDQVMSNKNLCLISYKLLTRNSNILFRTPYSICQRSQLTRSIHNQPAVLLINPGHHQDKIGAHTRSYFLEQRHFSSMPARPSIPWSPDNRPISDDKTKKSKPPPRPSPSSSTIVVSGSNKILLLHRTKTSSAFPSAHVFPGGNLEPSDGPLPENDSDPGRHVDSIAYRTGAIRELFEESGVLLARESSAPNQPLLGLTPDVRLAGRNDVHDGKISLREWLKQQSPTAVLDTDSLIPFTHWITPTNVPKRFTTQMYVYFVPVTERRRHLLATADQVETMSPEWKKASDWIAEARSGKIILFPPQFILLYLMATFLDKPGDPADGRDIPDEERMKRREALQKFMLEDRSPVPWTDKFISPAPGPVKWADGRNVLALDQQGPELKDSGLKGDTSRFVLVRFSKEGPRDVEVIDRVEAEAKLAETASTGAKL